MSAPPDLEARRRMWAPTEPGRLVGPGHPVGDFLEAHLWEVVAESEGVLRVRAHLPEQVKNPRGQLFGGFTPTYVDFVALHAQRAGRRHEPRTGWLATVNMRVDYFAPVVSEHFFLANRVVQQRGAMTWIETQFEDPEGTLLVHAFTTLRSVD
ncbi:MAG: PaaI family thioesterase [Proteobacteria bacterium]|nr:PaaI family thioesterase [Pseudomonadota bacterium]